MKSLLLSVFFSLFGIGIFVWLIQHIGFSAIADAFSEFPWWGIFVIVALSVLNFWIGVIRWQRILRYLGVPVSAKDIWGTWLAGFTFSYITPISYIGGEAIRTGFLRSKLGVVAYKGFASIAIDKIMESTIWIFVITAGLFLFLAVLGTPALGLANTLAIGGVVIVAGAAFVGTIYFLGFRKKRIVARVLGFTGLRNSQGGMFLEDTEREVLRFFYFRNVALWESLLLSFAKNAVAWSRLVFIVFLLGKGFALWQSIVMLAFTYIGYSAPVPAGFGTLEISQTFTLAALGLGAGTGVALVLLIRAGETPLVLAGAFFLVRYGMEFFLENIKKLVKW